MGQAIPFLKMHGAGNDFVVLDNRDGSINLTSELIEQLVERRYGVGCDQLVVMNESKIADVAMHIYNADGGKVSACGNATRCVGSLMIEEHDKPHVTIETEAGLLTADKAAMPNQIKVNMGAPKLDWQLIPLSKSVDTLQLPIVEGPLEVGVAVNMGNPHAVFFVSNVDDVDLVKHGSVLEQHELFPERTNVEAAEINSRSQMKVRVWERGVGITLACGTGACAAMVAAHMLEMVDDKVTVSLPGGDLLIEWAGSGSDVWMTGPVAKVYEGKWLG